MHDEKQQLVIILLIVFIGFMGTSMAYPIFPPLFLHPHLGTIVPATWSESTRSIFLGIALAAYPLGQFIGSPILGGYSDRYGRKRILMISLISSAMGYLLTAISLYYNWLSILLMSRLLTGIAEGNFAIVRAMAADLESISKYKSFGRINGCAAIGYVMGPLLGGLLSDSHIVHWFSFAFPFFLATLFSTMTAILAANKLTERKPDSFYSPISIWEQFNLIKRFHFIFKTSTTLKYLLIISSIFTFSVDIFYEFGPVYLTGLWSFTPAGIAIYNSILSFTLAVGSSFLPHFLSQYFSVRKITLITIFITACVFCLMSIFPIPLFIFILFGIAGLSISTTNTNITIELSNAADRSIQGETMGAQLSLRNLGDALICLIGGFVIVSSVTLPIVISFVIALISAALYYFKRDSLCRFSTPSAN